VVNFAIDHLGQSDMPVDSGHFDSVDGGMHHDSIV
jgi:hypothetical protein